MVIVSGRKNLTVVALAAGLLLPHLAAAQPHGIETRVENTTLLIDDLPPSTVGTLQIQRAFPRLTFANPVYMLQAPDDSNRVYVVEQAGRIKVFTRGADPDPAQTATLLDINARTLFRNDEQGLLALAFDPNYATNGRIYVHYTFGTNDSTTVPGNTRISRFTNSNPAGNFIDPSSEEILLTETQPFRNHNGGHIQFGADGMLYIGLGDGGSANDPGNRGQDLTTVLGKILRIDVNSPADPGLNYRIPPDNPFVSSSSARREIFAYGLRNPYRFTFDPLNEYLIAADVGQDYMEEVNHVISGGNYGWKIREGTDCRGGAATCENDPSFINPISQYRNTGARISITGGHVYYGSRIPWLYGMYLFADLNGEVFGIRYDGTAGVRTPTLLTSDTASGLDLYITGFGEMSDGEVYIINYSGQIYQLYEPTPTPPGTFPSRLSQMPDLLLAGKGLGHQVDGVIPYEPSAQLWSDGAHKERYMALPGLTQAGYTEVDSWNFPENTVLIKNFVLPLDDRDPEGSLRRVETRLMLRQNSTWHGFSYEWNEEQTDAQLLTTSKFTEYPSTDDTGAPTTSRWYFPSRNECNVCHRPVANRVLGITTAQLNSDFTYPSSGILDNQLRTLNHISLFDGPLPAAPESLPRMPDPYDVAEPLESRARAYLAANCSMCHRPGGGAPTTSMDLRWETHRDDMLVINALPSGDTLGLPNSRLVAPGAPERSIMLERMKRLDQYRMPPLASHKVDEAGAALLEEWILSLPSPLEASLWELY